MATRKVAGTVGGLNAQRERLDALHHELVLLTAASNAFHQLNTTLHGLWPHARYDETSALSALAGLSHLFPVALQRTTGELEQILMDANDDGPRRALIESRGTPA